MLKEVDVLKHLKQKRFLDGSARLVDAQLQEDGSVSIAVDGVPTYRVEVRVVDLKQEAAELQAIENSKLA